MWIAAWCALQQVRRYDDKALLKRMANIHDHKHSSNVEFRLSYPETSIEEVPTSKVQCSVNSEAKLPKLKSPQQTKSAFLLAVVL